MKKVNNNDWKSQLAQINQEMKNNMTESEKRKLKQEEAERRRKEKR